MAYELIYTEEAADNLESLDKSIAERITSKLERLAEYADVLSHFALSGQWSGYYRIRIGDYRAIYNLNHENAQLKVRVVGHRSKVYDE